MSSILEQLKSGEVTGAEIARRIEDRMRRKQTVQEGPPSPVEREAKRSKVELRASIKCGVRAPIPFPTYTLVDGTKYPLLSRDSKTAVFGLTKAFVTVHTVPMMGTVSGTPSMVDIVQCIDVGGKPASRIVGLVYEGWASV